MEILIQSVLEKARQLGTSIHLRYWETRTHPLGPPDNLVHAEGTKLNDYGNGRQERPSYVILRKEYEYLEPVVRSMFEEAKDVCVIVDRRRHDRRQATEVAPAGNRRFAKDRRVAAPMLDIMISVGA